MGRVICFLFFSGGDPANLRSREVRTLHKRGMCILRIAVSLKLANARGYPVDVKIGMNKEEAVRSPLAVNNRY